MYSAAGDYTCQGSRQMAGRERFAEKKEEHFWNAAAAEKKKEEHFWNAAAAEKKKEHFWDAEAAQKKDEHFWNAAGGKKHCAPGETC